MFNHNESLMDDGTQEMAVVYARVSSRTQSVKGYSLQDQVERCIAFARDGLGFPEERIIVFKGYETGMHLDRHHLNTVRTLIRQRTSQTLIVAYLDRLTRNLADLLLLRQELQQAGAKLWFAASAKQAAQTEEEQMLENIEVVMLQKEHGHTKRRVRASRNQKVVMQGKMMPNFLAPYGLKVVGEGLSLTLVPADDYTTDVVRMIFKWRGEERLGVVAIARRLVNQGIVTPNQHSGRKAPEGKHASGTWNHNTLLSILRNPVYKGMFYHNRSSIDEHGKQKRLPFEKWIGVPIEPVISEMLWEAAQGSFSRNRTLPAKQSRRKYLLSGLCRCGLCGRALAGRTIPYRDYLRKDGTVRTGQAISHYYCTSITSGKPCTLPAVPRYLLEETLWTWIVENVTHMDEHSLHSVFSTFHNSGQDFTNQQLHQQLVVLQNYQQKLDDNYKHLLLVELNKTYPTTIIDQTKAELGLVQQEIVQEQQRIGGQIADVNSSTSTIAMFDTQTSITSDMNFDDKRQILVNLHVTIAVSIDDEPRHQQDCLWLIKVDSVLGNASLSMTSRITIRRRNRD